MKTGLLCLLLMMATRLCGQFTVVHANQAKLPQGKIIKKEFIVEQGDTLYRMYERVAMHVEAGDTIVELEHFNIRNNWIVSRSVVYGDEEMLQGWQKEYTLNGTLEVERFCDTATGKCDIYKRYNYYPNGHLMAVLSYHGSHLQGSSLFYYNDGTLKNHLEYKKSRLWNVHAYYDQNGKILDQGDFCDGEGTLNVYAANGVMIKKKLYHKGKVRKVCKCSNPEQCPCD